MEQHLQDIIQQDQESSVKENMESILLKMFKLKMYMKVEKSIEILNKVIAQLHSRDLFESVENLADNYGEFCREHELLLQDFLVSLYKQHLSM